MAEENLDKKGVFRAMVFTSVQIHNLNERRTIGGKFARNLEQITSIDLFLIIFLAFV